MMLVFMGITWPVYVQAMPRKKQPGRTKAHISLPKVLKEEVEALSAKRGYTTSELISRLLERWVEKEKTKNPDATKVVTFE
jgi:metal-responsive CopG/Arc/MetJ family transcriptional regulator